MTAAADTVDMFVVVIEHRYGTNVGVHASRGDAVTEVAQFARNWWNDQLPVTMSPDGGRPEIPADDGAVIDAYFHAMAGEESYTITSTPLARATVDGLMFSAADAAAPPAASTIDAVRAEYTAQKARQDQARERARYLAVLLLVDVLARRLPDVKQLLVEGDSEEDWWNIRWPVASGTPDTEISQINADIGALPTDVGYKVWGHICTRASEDRNQLVVDVAELQKYAANGRGSA